MHSFWSLIARVVLVTTLLAGGFAQAQPEPTIQQVYAAAQAGKLDEAQLMVQQVLISHPTSAKAFYVQAELYARQGDAAHARASLAKAEQYAPGLPFAKSEAVQALRAQLSVATPAKPAPLAPSVPMASPERAAPPPQSSSWFWPLLLAGGAVLIGYLLLRRRQPAPQVYGPGGVPLQPRGDYTQYPQYAQQPGTGMGGRIAGGVATGLAVGAGVLAAEAIGRKLMGDDGSAHAASDSSGRDSFAPLSGNDDMGGNDFGISDGGSWDSGSSDGGGGWD